MGRVTAQSDENTSTAYDVFAWQRAVRDSDLKPGERLAAFVIATYADGNGRCFPSYETIAAGMGQTVPSAVRAVRGLRAAHLLLSVQKGRRRYLYLVTPESSMITGDHRPGSPVITEQPTEQIREETPLPPVDQQPVTDDQVDVISGALAATWRAQWMTLADSQQRAVITGAVRLAQRLPVHEVVHLLTCDSSRPVKTLSSLLRWRLAHPDYGRTQSRIGVGPAPASAFGDGVRLTDWDEVAA